MVTELTAITGSTSPVANATPFAAPAQSGNAGAAFDSVLRGSLASGGRGKMQRTDATGADMNATLIAAVVAALAAPQSLTVSTAANPDTQAPAASATAPISDRATPATAVPDPASPATSAPQGGTDATAAVTAMAARSAPSVAEQPIPPAVGGSTAALYEAASQAAQPAAASAPATVAAADSSPVPGQDTATVAVQVQAAGSLTPPTAAPSAASQPAPADKLNAATPAAPAAPPDVFARMIANAAGAGQTSSAATPAAATATGARTAPVVAATASDAATASLLKQSMATPIQASGGRTGQASPAAKAAATVVQSQPAAAPMSVAQLQSLPASGGNHQAHQQPRRAGAVKPAQSKDRPQTSLPATAARGTSGTTTAAALGAFADFTGDQPGKGASGAIAAIQAAVSAAAQGQSNDTAVLPDRPAQAVTGDTTAAQASTAADGAQADTPAASPRTVDQVANALALNIRSGQTEATISLRPAALGGVKVQISKGQDGLVIRMSAERDSVGELLRSRLGELRDVLAGRQVSVAELHVLHNPPAASGGREESAWRDQRRARQDAEADTGGNPRRQNSNEQTDEEAAQ